jgi:type IV pilus assembly protein PilM
MFFSKSTVLGIDFGASAIKAVELLFGDKEIELHSFGEVSLQKIEDGLPKDTERTYDEEIILRVRALLHKMQPKTDQISVSLPAYIGLVTLAEFPYLSDEELSHAVSFEAQKYVPSKLDDVFLSWEVIHTELPTQALPGGQIQVLLIAALKKEVEHYESYFQPLRVEPVFEELEIFSLARALTRDKEGTQMILDIGSKATNLIVVQNGQVQANSSVAIGGKDITNTIADTMGISLPRADDFKKSGVDLLNSLESGMKFPALDTIVTEFGRLQALVAKKNPTAQCKEIVLSGGGAQLIGLEAFFEKQINLPVEMGDPWRGIKMPKGFVRDNYFDTQFTVALGVALGQKSGTVKKSSAGSGSQSSLLELLNKKI